MIYLCTLFLLVYCSVHFDNCIGVRGGNYKLWLLIVMFFLIFISAFRFEIGADTKYSYMPTFEEYPSMDNLQVSDFSSTVYQPGWVIFNSLCKYIYPSYFTFQFIHAICLNLVILYFLKQNTRYVFTALLVYYIMNYLEYNTECLRESMAISCTLLALEFFKRKRYLFMCVLAVIAFNFHVSAIVALLIPLIFKIRYSKKSFRFMFIILLLSPFLYQLLPDQSKVILALTNREEMLNYFNNQFSARLNLNFYISHVVYNVFIPMLLIYYNVKKSDGKYVGFVYMFSVLQMLSVFSYAFYRFSNYMAPFYWLMLADCVRIYFQSNVSRWRNLFYLIAIFVGLYVCQGRLLVEDSDPRIFGKTNIYERYFPYKTWFLENN